MQLEKSAPNGSKLEYDTCISLAMVAAEDEEEHEVVLSGSLKSSLARLHTWYLFW